MNYIKTTVATSEYKEVEKMGSKYIVHLFPVVDGDTTTCVECMTETEPTAEDIEALKADYTEKMLPLEKASKVADINEYDTSDAVNAFMYQGQEMWLPRETRVSLMNTAHILGDDKTMTLWFGTFSVELPVTQVKVMLSAIEQYAFACYNVTAQHKSEVLGLESIEEVVAYDITKGYPEKLSF